MKFLLLSLTLLFATQRVNAEPYSAPFWLPSGNLQTIYPTLFATVPQVDYRRERWELPDGDFVDVDWLNTDLPITDSTATPISSDPAIANPANDITPIVVLFHGLEGNSQSQYAKALMAATKSKGWRGVVIHFRGCSGEPNRLPRVYYAGDTPEIEIMLSRLRTAAPKAKIYAVGVSLGGNALLKWLGESGEHASEVITKAAAVSAPMDLAESANALDKGFNRWVYTPRFVDSMRPKALAMSKRFPGLLDEQKINSAKTIHEIDSAVTAVLYGASSAEDYYAKNAAKPWLDKITLNTLIINAKNDPFMPAEFLPTQADVSSTVNLEYTDEGGHVGFVTSPFPGHVEWLPKHLLSFFEAQP